MENWGWWWSSPVDWREEVFQVSYIFHIIFQSELPERYGNSRWIFLYILSFLQITLKFKFPNATHCATVLVFQLRSPLHVCYCSSNHFSLPVAVAGSPERTTNSTGKWGSRKQSVHSNTRSLRRSLTRELLLHFGSNNYRVQINGVRCYTLTCNIYRATRKDIHMSLDGVEETNTLKWDYKIHYYLWVVVNNTCTEKKPEKFLFLFNFINFILLRLIKGHLK